MKFFMNGPLDKIIPIDNTIYTPFNSNLNFKIRNGQVSCKTIKDQNQYSQEVNDLNYKLLYRNYKDYSSYSKETKQLEEKLDKLKEQEADEISIKKMQEQISETAQMLPNSKTRIESALEDLQNLMSENEENNELKDTEDWKVAEQTLAEVKAFVETI